jgi:large subunit ribosomal protein L25
MADRRPTLEVEERLERGSRETRRLRRAGYVPGVVYGGRKGETDALSFKVGTRVLRAALSDGSALLDLKIGSEKPRPVIIKDQQIHPVREEILHIDLLQVRLDETIQTTVMVEIEGVEEAPGVKEGGVLEHATRELNIEALPTEIPERIVVDVSGMEMNATMHLSEISAPEGTTFLDDPEETIVATITPPSKVEEPEPEVEEEAELVGEEAEAEAGAEGATGEEAEQAAESAESAEE